MLPSTYSKHLLLWEQHPVCYVIDKVVPSPHVMVQCVFRGAACEYIVSSAKLGNCDLGVHNSYNRTIMWMSFHMDVTSSVE